MTSSKTDLFLLVLATAIAYVVIVLGAYVRLSDAGLGCPDWPGCYGKLIVPEGPLAIEKANQAFPDRPVEHAAAWKEMVHRYAASTLGFIILLLALKNWLAVLRGERHFLPSRTILLFLVLFQGALGMWTVTLLLKPLIVDAHLLGGMTILSLLYWQLISVAEPRAKQNQGFPAHWVLFAILLVFFQIALGGWTSANYSALVCTDFPKCQGEWWPEMNFREAFTLWRGLGVDYEGGVLDGAARTAIHVSHRVGALITFFVLSGLILFALGRGSKAVKISALLVAVVLIVQLSLGIANVLLLLPLPVAVAHNGVAALLLISLVNLLYFSQSTDRQAIY
ncbi:MAG: heme A synthase [Gammaproteobacteria bacterium]|nr:heme A synthase [Gammaproteobacteria bacterium]